MIVKYPVGFRPRHDRLKMTPQTVGVVQDFKIAHHVSQDCQECVSLILDLAPQVGGFERATHCQWPVP